MLELCSASFMAHVPFIDSVRLSHRSAIVFPVHMHMAVIFSFEADLTSQCYPTALVKSLNLLAFGFIMLP